jgi:hypothetical protein
MKGLVSAMFSSDQQEMVRALDCSGPSDRKIA